MHQSAVKHAYLFTKFIRLCQQDLKRWGGFGSKAIKRHRQDPMESETQKGTEMEGIIIPKSEQVKTFRDKLGSANSKRKFAETLQPLIYNGEQDMASQKQPTPIRQNARGRTNLILCEEGDGLRIW